MEKRYRIEHTLYESDRDAVEVMSFETASLGNTDILIQLENTYLKKNPELREMALWMINSLEENGCIEDDYREFFKRVLLEIKSQTGKDVKYVLWLAHEDAVREQYAKWYDGTEMDEYEVSDIILSDLGYDGALYGYEENPMPERSILI